MVEATVEQIAVSPEVLFETHPDRYQHWKLDVDGSTATLTMNVLEDGGIRPGYKLKLNSYDLGVDIELHDALQRIRFEYPEVRVVVLTSAKERIFCSGANIFMLGVSSHAWKVNFCKFTNETRNGIEDSSRYSGIKFIAAVNGACAGGGYEMALACDEILLVDDRSSAVSLPEVPLLAVLPGTGGLTRLTDKRKVRHDLADIFCTTTEGVRGQRAKDWGLVDAIAKPVAFADALRARVRELAESSDRPRDQSGVMLTPLNRRAIPGGDIQYGTVSVTIDRPRRLAEITVHGPKGPQPSDPKSIQAAGTTWWPLQFARELDDAILSLRTNESEIGTWILKTQGTIQAVIEVDSILETYRDDWFVRETVGFLRRSLARLDVTSRTIFALIERGSCFVGTLLELALAADRIYMQTLSDDSPHLSLTEANFGVYPMVNGKSRLQQRFYDDSTLLYSLNAAIGEFIGPDRAMQLGLVTATPDELDWQGEVRLALEERASLSPDALTGLEANLRFGVYETMASRIFGRLSAWQNWIFIRANAVGDKGALRLYGKGDKAAFDFKRV